MTPDIFLSQMVTAIDDKIFILGFKLFIICIVILLFKNLVEGVVAHLLFRFDSYMAIGCRVKIEGHIGRVYAVNLNVIVIKCEEGYMRIPIRKWRNTNYMILKNDKHNG